MDEELTETSVRLAYKLILGRAVEDTAMVRHALGYKTVRRLRDAFLNSREFGYILNLRPRLVNSGAPPLDIAWQGDDARVKKMLAEVAASWDAAPPPKADGATQAADLAACLRRNGLPSPDAADAFEFGCGQGRITQHLAPMVRTLTATDAAPGQLAVAREMAAREKLANLTLHPADDLRFGMTGNFDLWYSYHALHFSPPPLAARVLARALSLLRPGGVAVFQLVTYASGYAYAVTDAVPPPHADPYDDRHVLPQSAVFALAAEADCAPLEVFDDGSVAPSVLWRSSFFVLQKRKK
jgi:SAM-dependent methyltransferase